MLIVLIATFLGIAALEVPGLIKRNLWRELGVFLLVWVMAFTFSLLLALNVDLPNLVEVIEFLAKKAAGLAEWVRR